MTIAGRKVIAGGNKPPAVVVALDGMNGIQTARILARRGVPVVGVAKDPKNPACRTNACRSVLAADLASDDLIRTLESLGPRLGTATGPRSTSIMPWRTSARTMACKPERAP